MLFLGISRQTVQGHFEEIRKYQTEKDWTYRRSNENIIEHAKELILLLIEMKY